MMEQVFCSVLVPENISYDEILDSMDDKEPYLCMEIEPEIKYRFRYESEGGSHGGLSGKTRKNGKKTFPTVKLMNYNGSNQDIFIRVSLCTEKKTDHVLEFKKKKSSGNRTYIDEDLDDDFCAIFKDLTILSKKKEDVYQALMDRKIKSFGKLSKSAKEKLVKENNEEVKKEAKDILNSVVLRFEAFERIKSKDEVQICPPLYSEPICNQKTSSKGELKICRMSKVSGSWKGGEEMILLCEKVQKDNIKIKFFETDNSEYKWEAYAKFLPADVHYQVAIPFKTPKYKANIEKTVAVCLERGDEISDLRYFTYLPEDSPTKKRKKCMPEETVNLISSPMEISSPSSSSAALSDDNSQGTSQLMQSLQEMLKSPENTPNFSNSSSVEDLENPSSVLDNDLFMQFQLSDIMNFVLTEEDPFEVTVSDNSEHEDRVVNQCLELDNFDDVIFPIYNANKIQMDIGKIEGQMAVVRLDDSKSTFGISKEISKIESMHKILKDKEEKLKKYQNLISRRDNNGNTLLHLAIKYDKSIGIIMRMNNMPQSDFVNLQNTNKQTALHIAVEKNADVVKDLLLNFADPHIKNAEGNNCFHIACQHDFEKSLKYFFLYRRVIAKKSWEFNHEGLTPLHIAVKNLSVNCLFFLIHRYDIDLNIIEQKCGRSVLHYAVEFSPALVLPLLEKKKTDINCQDYEGNTPLHIACGENNYDVVKLLLEAGADPGIKNFKQNNLNSDDEGSGDEATSVGQTPADLLSSDSKILDLFKATEYQCGCFEDPGSSSKFEDLEKSLSSLLDQDMRWKTVATYVLDEKYFSSLECSPNPTRAILEYMKRNCNGDYIEELKTVLELVGFNDAIKFITEKSKPL